MLVCLFPWCGCWHVPVLGPVAVRHRAQKNLIKKEYCRCGPHPLQVTSSRVGPPLVKATDHTGPLFLEFRGWPLWFMASIALQGPQHLAPGVVPGASLHSGALSPDCGGNVGGLGIVGRLGMWEPGDGGYWGLLLTGCWGDGTQAHGTQAPASATWLGGVGVWGIGINAFLGGGLGMC